MSTRGWEQQRGPVRCSALQHRYRPFQIYLQCQRKPSSLLRLRPKRGHYKCHYISCFRHETVTTRILWSSTPSPADLIIGSTMPTQLPVFSQQISYGSFCTGSHGAPSAAGYRGTITWTGIFIFFFGHTLSTNASGLVLPGWVSSWASETEKSII